MQATLFIPTRHSWHTLTLLSSVIPELWRLIWRKNCCCFCQRDLEKWCCNGHRVQQSLSFFNGFTIMFTFMFVINWSWVHATRNLRATPQRNFDIFDNWVRASRSVFHITFSLSRKYTVQAKRSNSSLNFYIKLSNY